MTKRIIAVAMALIMAVSVCLLYDFHTTAQAAGDYSVIKVLLSTNNSTTFTFTVAGEYSVKENPMIAVSRGSCTITLESGNLYIETGGVKTKVGSEITLVRHVGIAGQTNYLTLYNTRYKANLNYLGNMHFSINSNTIRVVNQVPLEEYLYGVVPHEMSNSWPIEALKAQAVAARGYAISMMKSASAVYHVVDYSYHQVYKGYNANNQNAIEAVDQTAGQGLTYNGTPISLMYSASNGGQTELSGNAWVTNLGYLEMKDDPYDLANPYSLEETSFIPAEFTSTTRAFMDSIVLDKLEEGAKTALGETDVTLVSTTAVTPKEPVYDAPSKKYTKVDVTMQVRVGDAEQTQEVTVTIVLNDLVYSSSNQDGIFDLNEVLRLKGAEAATYTDDQGITYQGWNLTNRGWGHGVGMSQRGAQQMAKEGLLYTDILFFYYVNTELTTYDTQADPLTVKPTTLKGIPARCTGEDVNFRSGPGTGNTSIEKIPKDAYLTILELNYTNGWHQVYYHGVIGYISATYVEVLDTGSYTLPGWLTLASKRYYLDEEGYAVTGLHEIGDATYYFNEYGVLQTGFLQVSNKRYYANADGVLQGGWFTVSSKKYYADPSTFVIQTGKIKVDSKTYIADTTGVIQTGGLITYGSDLYYANADGVLQSGTITVDGVEYTFDTETYAAIIDEDMVLATTKYHVDSKRVYVTGVARETSIDSFLKGFVNPATVLRVVNSDGKAVTSGYVGTGMKVQCVVGNAVRDELTVSILGDVSGDGYIDVSDILVIQAYILGKRTINAAETKAADINTDGYVDVNDILKIQADILGKSKIEQ